MLDRPQQRIAPPPKHDHMQNIGFCNLLLSSNTPACLSNLGSQQQAAARQASPHPKDETMVEPTQPRGCEHSESYTPAPCQPLNTGALPQPDPLEHPMSQAETQFTLELCEPGNRAVRLLSCLPRAHACAACPVGPHHNTSRERCITLPHPRCFSPSGLIAGSRQSTAATSPSYAM